MGKYVNPIKLKVDRQRLLSALKEQSERNYMLGLLGMTFGLRVCDLITLTVNDVIDNIELTTDLSNTKQYIIRIIEQKTKKEREIYINETIYKQIQEYCKDKPKYAYLFESRNSKNGMKPICEAQASRIIRSAAKKIGIRYNISSHSLRKTYAFAIYTDTKDINLVADLLNHSNTMVTRKYIGIDKEAKLNASRLMCSNII